MQVSSLCLLVCVLLVQPARAAAKDSIVAMEKAAKKACISGDYVNGVSLLSQLYVDTNDAIYVFNQGRCFEQNGRYEEAILRFREYDRKIRQSGRPTDPETARHISDCQALLEKSQPAVPAAAPTPAPVQIAPALSEAKPVEVVSEPLQPDVTATTPMETSPGRGLRIAGAVTFGVGIAGLASGVFLNLKANSVAHEMDALPKNSRQDKENTRSRYETSSWVAYGAGAACAAGGVLLYYLGYRQGHDTPVAFMPTATDHAVGAVVLGAF